MKIIIDLDDAVAGSVMAYCDETGSTPSELFTNLFNKYMQQPFDILNEIMVNGEDEEFIKFQKLLYEYFNEAIYDIESIAESSEAYETDKAIANVFKVLARDHLKHAYIITSLYKAYKERN